MELEAACAVMCDSTGKLLFYSNGCYVANSTHQMMVNGDSIGKGYFETSFCKTGGNPLTQGMIALPKPGSNHLYYLFYTDFRNPYQFQPFYPLTPLTLYYSVIDMDFDNGLGAVVEKHQIVLEDTLSRAMLHAEKHSNNKDWWIFMPESHSNCYWTIRLTENGIDTLYNQCLGVEWGDDDPTGQAVFSPNGKKYARFNFFYGLNIFDFDNNAGQFSNSVNIDFGQDTFYWAGAAFSSNSRFIYACAYNKLWQFDLLTTDISASRILVGVLNTPPGILEKTHFNQARLAPDGKIYIAGRAPNKHLHVINRPNCSGQACDLQQYAIELAARNTNTMPNMPHFKQWSDTDTCQSVSITTPANLNNAKLQLYPNPAFDEVELVLPPSLINRNFSIELINSIGQTVKTVFVSKMNHAKLTVGDLPVGLYLVSVSDNGELFFTEKLVISQ